MLIRNICAAVVMLGSRVGSGRLKWACGSEKHEIVSVCSREHIVDLNRMTFPAGTVCIILYEQYCSSREEEKTSAQQTVAPG